MSKGIDIVINNMVTYFTANLWTSIDSGDKDYFGRIFRNTRNEQIIPERFVLGEYSDTLLNDRRAVTCFFDVLPEEEYNFGFTSEVWILFSVNLTKLYPSITTERATEYVHEDVIKKIKRVAGWKVTGLVRGLPAFDAYGFIKPGHNLHPFYLFRINCNVKYPLNC